MQRTLIVEDDADTSELMACVLTQAGFDVRATESAFCAMSLAKHVMPDVILLDLVLPFRSGASLMAQLRADAATAHIPIVLVTGYAEALPPEQRTLAASVVTKPFHSQTLLAAVRAASAHSESAQPA
jgi:DNA-binding response OmpR family regulator